MRENIIIGDAHGCRDEFNHLLDKLKYDVAKHRIILVGDILDRGPDPIGLLHQIRKMELEAVLGNHEEKALRWRRHEAMKDLTGQDNPMKELTDQRRDEWLSLTKSDLQWLTALPLKLRVKDNWYVVHAGMEPGVPFDKQDLERIIRLRYVYKNGTYAKPKKDKAQPPNSEFWAGKWTQPYNIVFGHQRFEEPKIFKNENNTCIGIDTGCCFGNTLTAFNVERNEYTQVKANKVYYKRS
jgi:bis(5'-nucleosyl)-tetraphosphatase (symmetrical)